MPADNKKETAITISFFIDVFLMLNGFFVFVEGKVMDFFYFEKLRIMVLADFDQRHFEHLFKMAFFPRCSDLIIIFSGVNTSKPTLL